MPLFRCHTQRTLMIHELHYSPANTYLISGSRGYLLFDTGWSGTFQAFCRQLGDLKIPLQKISYVHAADAVLQREPEKAFHPIDDAKLPRIPIKDSRGFLEELGIAGEILAKPGHSDDSISLCLDDGSIFVGDLNPLYELELHCVSLLQRIRHGNSDHFCQTGNKEGGEIC